MNTPKRIPVVRELMILLRQSFRVLLFNKINFMISLLFPFVAASIVVWIAGKDMFVNMESTKSASFILVCAAIWGGLFNSIQTIVRERKSIRRDYTSGALRIGCYIFSRACVQLILCAFQSAILTLSFYGVQWVYGNNVPTTPLILNSVILEYYVTIFLIVFAADTMGLCISSFVKNAQLASQLAPYILIVQLLFSGVLFSMEGLASNVSVVTLSRWGMEALGSIGNLNALPLRLQSTFPTIPHEVDQAFLYTPEHLKEVWMYLTGFVIIPLVVSHVLLHNIKNDKRG